MGPAVASSTSASDSTSFVDRSRRRRRGAVVVHWGAPLGALDGDGLAATAVATAPAGDRAALDVVAPIAVVPEHGSGFPGRPGLRGHRARRRGVGAALHARARSTSGDGGVESSSRSTPSPGCASSRRVELDPGGARRIELTLTNDGDDRYLLDGLTSRSPLPDARRRAADVPRPLVHASSIRVAGRSADGRVRRREPARAHVARAPAAAVRRHGRLRRVARARCGAPTWRGAATTESLAERLPDGRRAAPARRAAAPRRGRARARRVVPHAARSYAVHSAAGLDAGQPAVPRRRARAPPAHPRRPRPCAQHLGGRVLRPRLRPPGRASPSGAAAVGVERFVLDDGWFGGRRDDRAGLGDWWVSPDAHPDGLAPLIEHVRALGMEFGIWVEPEMVNPDSDLYRAHPEWALVDRRLRAGARPQPARARPRQPRRLRRGARPPRRAARRPRHRLRQVGHEPRPRAGAPAPTARPAPTPRRSPCTAARRAARAPPRRRDRELLVGRGADRPRDPAAAPSGCGRATATTRSSARRSSAAPRC